MVSKKPILAVIIVVIVVGFAISYFADSPVLIVGINSLTMDKELIESKISEYYQNYLNREPDSAGLGFYKQRILEGNSFEWVEEQIKNSNEAKAIQFELEFEQKINEFYHKYLNREPDAEGLKYYKQEIIGGVSYDSIESEFKNSDEAKIVALYNKYLGRAPDPEGLDHYLQRLQEGESYQSIEELFKNSDEAKSFQFGLEVEAKITEFYHKYLNREPDPEGLNYWKQQIIEGKSYDWVENEFKNSEEAQLIQNYLQ